ncbi:MAG: peptidase S41, partial [Muribaculaceae bacterium]|nr:peptidase S41 [Muribaculaceae bacterium]
SRILGILRGPKGSVVPLTVVRRGEAEPMMFSVERDDIPIHSVDASFMADPTTGYIRITRFAENTADELKEALADLKRQGMKNLIIDLEDNGGGYLGAATEIASEFLPKGAPIVYTDAEKLGTSTYDNERKGSFLDGRIVVMVNQYSASASEILSGAFQDNDRGLIVGRRTFGKGLVQRPFNFPDGSMIRLTVSRYFTPSGRCIQRPYDRENLDDYNLDILHRYEHGEFTSADSVQLDKSQAYYTLHNHRPVYGGGGIMPDLFVPLDTTAVTPCYRQLLAKGIINRYAITYVDDNRDSLHTAYPTEQSFIDGFNVGPELIDGLAKMATTSGIELKEDEFENSTPMLRTILKGLIGRDLFQTSTYYKVVYPILNDEYIAALQLINDKKMYETLLKHGQKAK